MKVLFGLFLLTFASISMADEACTYAIKDRYGYEVEYKTSYSYSIEAACSNANYACLTALQEAQRNGKYYDATCVYKSNETRPPFPPSNNYSCTTDMLDYYGYTVKTFSGFGYSMSEACSQSEQQCRYELNRGNTIGRSCVTRNQNPGPFPPGPGPRPPGPGPRPPGPRPPAQSTAQCTANRYDPAGTFIQSYYASYTGTYGTDVKGEACRRAVDACSREIRGRQTCRAER